MIKNIKSLFISCIMLIIFFTPKASMAVSPEMDASGFVSLTEFAPDIMLEMRYYKTYNFIGDRIRGYEEPICLVTKATALALKAVNDELAPKGLCLKIYDSYRPQRAVDHFVEWAKNLNDVRMKDYFYPETDKSVLFVQGYIASRSGHSRGSTVDLTIYDKNNECDLDMGGTFDYFGTRSHPYYSNISTTQYNNRMLLRDTMYKHGFYGIDTEWWHFTLRNEPYPYTYFNFPVSHASLNNH